MPNFNESLYKRVSRKEFLKTAGLITLATIFVVSDMACEQTQKATELISASATFVLKKITETINKTSTKTPVPSRTATLPNTPVASETINEIGISSDTETMIEGLYFPRAISPAIKAEEFAAANPGMTLALPENDGAELTLDQFLDPNDKVSPYKGSAVKEEFTKRLFKLETGKNGITKGEWNGESITQVAPYTYMNANGEIMITAYPFGFPALFTNDKGTLMAGVVGGENKLDTGSVFPAFRNPSEIAATWGYNKEHGFDAGNVMFVQMEPTATGKLSGRLEIISGKRTELTFIGNKTTEQFLMTMNDEHWNYPIPDNIVAIMKATPRLPSKYKEIVYSGNFTGCIGFVAIWGDSRVFTDPFDIETKEGTKLATALAYAPAYFFDREGNPEKIYVIRAAQFDDGLVEISNYKGAVPWNKQGWDNIALNNPKIYSQVFGIHAGQIAYATAAWDGWKRLPESSPVYEPYPAFKDWIYKMEYPYDDSWHTELGDLLIGGNNSSIKVYVDNGMH